MTLEAIKEAIAELPALEKTTLINWLAAQDSDAWDEQIAVDFADGGRGISLVAQWDAEIKARDSIALENFLSTSEKRPAAK